MLGISERFLRLERYLLLLNLDLALSSLAELSPDGPRPDGSTSTVLPPRFTTKGVPVSSAISRAFCAARFIAASYPRSTSSLAFDIDLLFMAHSAQSSKAGMSPELSYRAHPSTIGEYIVLKLSIP